MSDPVEDGDRPDWGLRVVLVLLGICLLGAIAAVWLVSSDRFDPPWAPRDLPQPKPQQGQGGHTITSADWRRKPSGDDVARFYPREAADKHVGGRAVIACGVTAEGRLAGCRIVSETPPGWGFGEAALSLSGEFRMWPKTRDGQPVAGAQVRIPIVFRPPEG